MIVSYIFLRDIFSYCHLCNECSTIYRTPCAAVRRDDTRVSTMAFVNFSSGIHCCPAIYQWTMLRLKRIAEEFAVGTSGIIGWWLSSRMLRPLTPVGGSSFLASFATFLRNVWFSPWKIPVYFTTIGYIERLTIFPLSTISPWQQLLPHSEMTL